MNLPIDSHDPTPEFRARLEWQVETALRRETRFTAPVSAGRLRRVASALIVVAALVIGGLAGIASGQVQDARERDRLIESARADESLATLRLELARAEYQEAQRRFETGTASRGTLAAAERHMRAMEAALKRTQMDIEEIRATAAAPRNDLQAPLVGQRDFVRDRLALELAVAEQGLVAAEQSLALAQERMKVGVGTRAAQLQAEAEVAQERTRMEMLRATLEIRQRSLSGQIKAGELASAALRMELSLRRQRVEREIEIARRRIDEIRRLVSTGMASQLELKRAEVEQLELETELKQLQLQLERLAAPR